MPDKSLPVRLREDAANHRLFASSFHPARLSALRKARDLEEAARIVELAEMPPMTIDEIEALALKTVDELEDGLKGFGRSWGWRQFARNLLAATYWRLLSKELKPAAKTQPDDPSKKDLENLLEEAQVDFLSAWKHRMAKRWRMSR